ncbi:MAG: GMC family oxidoreductase [Bacteroidia bacterium]|nr:GMC family oxidoreductase [Bacteroidia bacterium]
MRAEYDVVIIGSGAAGSVMAYQTIRNNPGIRVAVLEKGKRVQPQSFTHDTLDMMARVYKNGGLQTTKDNDVVFAQGQAVGGSTVINNAIWLRADLDAVLPEWEKHKAFVDKQALLSAYAEIERALHVVPIDPLMANAGSEFFLKGCRALGIQAEYLKHNRKDCIGCGWCNFGCRYNRKTSMLVTYLPWAEQRGVDIIDGARDVRILHQAGEAKTVEFSGVGDSFSPNATSTIKAGKVIVCAGAIGSSEVLLRSNINPNGRTGLHFHALGGVLVSAEAPMQLDGFDNIGLTCMAHASPDYLVESYFTPPAVFSLSISGWFNEHYRKMKRYNHYAQAGVMVATDPTGRISINKKGHVEIDLVFSQRDVAGLKEGIKTLARIYFAAGALRVIPATYEGIDFLSVNDLTALDARIKAPDDLLLGSAHPQGGNVMSDDPRQGVVDCGFKVHGYSNVYVVDASVFPTNIKANCQATVMAMAHYASKVIVG